MKTSVKPRSPVGRVGPCGASPSGPELPDGTFSSHVHEVNQSRRPARGCETRSNLTPRIFGRGRFIDRSLFEYPQAKGRAPLVTSCAMSSIRRDIWTLYQPISLQIADAKSALNIQRIPAHEVRSFLKGA